MVLGFKKKIGNWQTHFAEKITCSLMGFDSMEFTPKKGAKFIVEPKHHTIRHDFNRRWKAGMKIHCDYGVRTKHQVRFAELSCTGVQDIIIYFYPYIGIDSVVVDGKTISYDNLVDLSVNDGFSNVDGFEDYFRMNAVNLKDERGLFYEGRIIHWTNLRY